MKNATDNMRRRLFGQQGVMDTWSPEMDWSSHPANQDYGQGGQGQDQGQGDDPLQKLFAAMGKQGTSPEGGIPADAPHVDPMSGVEMPKPGVGAGKGVLQTAGQGAAQAATSVGSAAKAGVSGVAGAVGGAGKAIGGVASAIGGLF